MVALAHSRYVTQLVEPETGRVIASLENPGDIVTSQFTFDEAGSMLAVVTPHHAALVWDLRLMRQRLREMGLDWSDD